MAANAMWQAFVLRLLHRLMEGYTLYIHPTTKSVMCTFVGAQPESDVVCLCGTCGSKCGVRPWVPLEADTIRNWPTMGLKSRSKFQPSDARRKAMKDKGTDKAKSDVHCLSESWVCNPTSVDIVPTSGREDNGPSFEGPSGLNEQTVRSTHEESKVVVHTHFGQRH